MARPVALSIAGFDPSGGAGILSDCKTFEEHKIYGLGVVTALTIQNENEFKGLEWTPLNVIINQLNILANAHFIKYVKIGLVQNLNVMVELKNSLLSINPKVRIIWDPILKATAGFQFHEKLDIASFEKVCNGIFLLTPNIIEMQTIYPALSPTVAAENLSNICSVFLKGGHSETEKGKDYLYQKGKKRSYNPKKINVYDKHGSGCVLSSSITANMAKGNTLHVACMRAKKYMAKYMHSNKTLLGYHKM